MVRRKFYVRNNLTLTVNGKMIHNMTQSGNWLLVNVTLLIQMNGNGE